MMKKSSTSALTWLAAILLFIGLLILSPSGSFLVFILAALFAAAPAIFGTKKMRIAAIILLIASIFLAASQYSEFKNEHYRTEKRNKTIQSKETCAPGYSCRNNAICYQQQG
jgi:membrane protein implicated in regulation of membrane protease activity